jgi:hypothetical protein
VHKLDSKPHEMKNFDDALRRVLRVSKDELKELLAEDKAASADKPKRGPRSKHPTDSGSQPPK